MGKRENTLEDWKRTPSTVEALFAIDLPYRPPKNPVGAFLWRQRIWIETTCGLSLLEPWEKLLVLTILHLFLTLLCTGVYKFAPQQVSQLYRRALYYLFGISGDGSELRRLVRVGGGGGGRAAQNASVGEL
ncbi:hypothetical protein C8Q74DRAFT_1205469 [Fomes fomentarius]|nr:hypothetical protein C8Q74DRAFT_1205469 [Fomes fomentarius]